MIVHAASLLAWTAVLASLGSLGPAGIPGPAAGIRPQQASEQGADTPYLGRTRKYQLRFARAADISQWLGGQVLTPSTDRLSDPGRPYVRWRPGAANLLPDGIDSVTAYDVDNTLIIKYSS